MPEDMLPALPWSLGAALFLGLHYILLRAAAGRVDDRLGALVVETAAAIGVACSLLLGVRGPGWPGSRAGIGFSAASGLAVSVASIFIFVALRRGGALASTGTIVLGGGMALSAAAAPWLFGEAITLRRCVGVGLGLAAVWVLAGES
jgi:uncharacterized membrane protein